MIRYRHALLALLLTLLCGVATAQNNTNSPYTRYGYGQLADPGSSNSKGMGGIAYGLRDKFQTNFANPASYTAVDSLTFIFDGGISLQNTNFSDGRLKQNAKNSSFDYITMQFRASKWAAISAGLMPFSNVGYSMGRSVQAGVNVPANVTTYSGEGGLHQLYVGAGFKILKNLSLGANISYLWGDITRQRSQTLGNATDYMLETVWGVALQSYKLDLGLQYTARWKKKHALTLGAVFSPGHDLKTSEAYVQDMLGNRTGGYTTALRDTVAKFSIPSTIGAGVTYVYDERLTVGADVTYQDWTKATYMDDDNAFCKRLKVAVGAEYIPSKTSRSYLGHVKYRVGAFYSKPYYKIDGERAANEYGVTAGLGFPLPRNRSVVSLSAQYVKTAGTRASFVDENTLRVCLGITFNERWFFKFKVD